MIPSPHPHPIGPTPPLIDLPQPAHPGQPPVEPDTGVPPTPQHDPGEMPQPIGDPVADPMRPIGRASTP